MPTERHVDQMMPAIDALRGRDAVRREQRVERAIDNQGNVILPQVLDVGGAWNGRHLRMGLWHLWIDASGNLRKKNGAPASDTDGVIV